MGLALSEIGMPRMAGRLLAALLVADPPEQSAEDLAATLQASRGSVSTMTRLLEAPGIIERLTKPGDRKVYYRNRPDAFALAMQRDAEGASGLAKLAEKGLKLLDGADPEVRRGLEDMYAFYAFWEREIHKVLADWRRERESRDANDR